jgi:hypothetical protein
MLYTNNNQNKTRLRSLYPEIRCKIFYQRDYLHLLVKYGLAEPEDVDLPAAPTRIPGPVEVTNLAERVEENAAG